jgi:hypothetical protein
MVQFFGLGFLEVDFADKAGLALRPRAQWGNRDDMDDSMTGAPTAIVVSGRDRCSGRENSQELSVVLTK